MKPAMRSTTALASVVVAGAVLMGSWFVEGVRATAATAKTTTETTSMFVTETMTHFRIHSFDINADADDLIPAPGTPVGTPSPGDQSLVNDQLTSTKEHDGSFPIVGFDSGTCVYTRTVPDGQSAGSPYNSIIEHCLATAQFAHGSITASGVIVRQGSATPRTTEFTVLGGTGTYAGTSGTMTLTFGKDFNTYSFALR